MVGTQTSLVEVRVQLHSFHHLAQLHVNLACITAILRLWWIQYHDIIFGQTCLLPTISWVDSNLWAGYLFDLLQVMCFITNVKFHWCLNFQEMRCTLPGGKFMYSSRAMFQLNYCNCQESVKAKSKHEVSFLSLSRIRGIVITWCYRKPFHTVFDIITHMPKWLRIPEVLANNC